MNWRCPATNTHCMVDKKLLLCVKCARLMSVEPLVLIKNRACSAKCPDVPEIGGGDGLEEEYLDRIGQHKLNAAFEIGNAKQVLRNVTRGLETPSDYLGRFSQMPEAGESRKRATWLVSVVHDHDNLSCEKVGFSFTAPTEHQIVAALALQFFTLSIPCIYYGSEQYLSYNAPAAGPGYQVNYLEAEGWGFADWYLREAMFGPGPFGTSGFHCFDETNPTFARVAHLLAVRQQKPTLRIGRQYQRPLGQFGWGNLD